MLRCLHILQKAGVLVVLLLASLSTFAQFDKYLQKSDDYYDYGNYEKAKKQIIKLQDKAGKKLGPENKYTAIAYSRQAKIENALGVYNEVQPNLDKALELSARVNKQNPTDHAFMYLDAAELMLDYGHMIKAEAYLDTAWQSFEQEGALIEALQAKMNVMKARILSEKGYFNEALQMIDEQNDYYKQRAALRSGTRDEQTERKREYAILMITKANTYRFQGDYLKADEAFVANNRWIEQNLGKQDILHSYNQYLNTRLLEENGLYSDAMVKMYDDAYAKSTKDYAGSHQMVMAIKERQIKSYLLNGNNSKFNNAVSNYKKNTRKFYQKNSVNYIMMDLILYDKKLDKGSIKTLENDVANTLARYDVIPRYHPKRLEVLDFAATASLFNKHYQNTEGYLVESLEISEELYGKDAPRSHLARVKLANHYIDYTNKFEEASQIYQTSFEQVLLKEINEGHQDYVEILNHLAKYYEANDEYDKASETLDKALEVSRTKYDNQDYEYAIELDQIANLQIKLAEYDKATDNIETAIGIFRESRVDEDELYLAQALITEANLLTIKGLFDEAEDRLVESVKLKTKKKLANIEIVEVSSDDDLARLYLGIGLFNDADELIEKSLREKTQLYGDSSRYLIEPLNLRAQYFLITGDYAQADQVANRSYRIGLDVYGVGSSKLVGSLGAMAQIYTIMGDYERAEASVTESLEIQKSRFQEDHIDVGKSVAQLALIRYYNGEPLDEVEELFQQSENIIGQKLGSNNPTYAGILKNMALVFMSSERYDLAFAYLDQAGEIYQAKIGRRNNVSAASIDILKGDIYYHQRDYSSADDHYQDAKKMYERVFSDHHPEYVRILSKLSRTYYMQDDIRRAKSSLDEALKTYQLFIRDYFPALSERQKAKFWNTIKSDYEFFNHLAVSLFLEDANLIQDIYDNTLMTKAILLNSSIKIRERILSSGDEELIQLYNKWQSQQEFLTYVLSLSQQQLLENEIDQQALAKEVEALEQELSLRSELFGRNLESASVTWENVRNAMEEDEVAVELVRYRYFDHVFTDSVVYAALYVSGARKAAPSMVLLKNGADLESKYLKYYRNSMKFQLEDNYSYVQYWKPIIDRVRGASTIFLSADGVYNQINLESLFTPEGDYVIDQSNIVLVSNTKDLYTNKAEQRRENDEKRAAMFGDPKFYVNTAAPEEGENASRASRSSSVPFVVRLPGTKKEVNEVKGLLTKNGWNIQDYLEQDASEQAIKGVVNPKIFHIATHGFFETRAIEEDEIEFNENRAFENPLLRTGLLLTGAGDILNETSFNYNIDNGILTAYEAMSLNLDLTDLVVLSACETGLGEVEAGEGVYGLQRAFLVAGAGSVVMSLFKVDDLATQDMMITFYDKWLQTGDKRGSFIAAKKEIRDKYKHPIYWGPFVMIGLN